MRLSTGVLLLLCLTVVLFSTGSRVCGAASSVEVMNTPPPSSDPLTGPYCQYVPPSRERGTISGAVTVPAGNGKTVSISCDCASTSVMLTGNTGKFALPSPVDYGRHFIKATLNAYVTAHCFVTVSAMNPRPACNLVLIPIRKEMTMSVAPQRIPPDGKSQATIDISLSDPHGSVFAHEPVSWSADLGTIVRADRMTDSEGKARMVLCAASSPGTAVVCATAKGLQKRCVVEFSAPEAPSIWIVHPSAGETVRDRVTVWMHAAGGGGNDDIISVRYLFVDGKRISATPRCHAYVAGWDTHEYANGRHTLTATLFDWQEHAATSNTVTVEVDNLIGEIQVYPQNADPGQPVEVSAKLSKVVSWRASVTDLDIDTNTDREIWHAEGKSSFINVQWPGTETQGIYKIKFAVPSSGEEAESWVLVQSWP